MMIPTVPFKEAIFWKNALKFRSEIKIPLIYVGGLVSREKIDEVLNEGFEVRADGTCFTQRTGVCQSDASGRESTL